MTQRASYWIPALCLHLLVLVSAASSQLSTFHLTDIELLPESGAIETSEIYRYEARVEADPSFGSIPNALLRLPLPVPSITTIVPRTARTTQGTILAGNLASDSELLVDLGTLVPGHPVLATLDLRLDSAVSSCIFTVSTRASLTAPTISEELSVDPEGRTLETNTPINTQTFLTHIFAVEDAGSDGIADPAERLTYTVAASYSGDALSSPSWLLTGLSNATLVTGSVTASPAQAQILDGNDPGDTAVQVTLPTLDVARSMSIQFDVLVDELPAPGETQIVATGSFSRPCVVPDVRQSVIPLPAGLPHLAITNDDGGVANSASVIDDGSGPGDLHPEDNQPRTTPHGADGATGPDLFLLKFDDDLTANPGDVVTYTLNVANIAEQTATGVVLEETVPLNTSFEADTSDPRWSCADLIAGSPCTLDLGSIGVADELLRVPFAVRVLHPVPAGVTEIHNSASLADDGSGGRDLNPEDNHASETTPLDVEGGTGPDLVLSKSDGGVTVNPGDLVIYALTVTNRGNQHASGVVIEETVAESSRFAPEASEPGWTCTDPLPGSLCLFDLGDVAVAAEPIAVAFAVRIDEVLPVEVVRILNSASVADDGTGGQDLNPADNWAGDTTPLDGTLTADLVVTETDDLEVVEPRPGGALRNHCAGEGSGPRAPRRGRVPPGIGPAPLGILQRLGSLATG